MFVNGACRLGIRIWDLGFRAYEFRPNRTESGHFFVLMNSATKRSNLKVSPFVSPPF